MKKINHQIKATVASIMLYLLILGIGLFVFAVFPTREHLPRLLETAATAAEEYKTNGIANSAALTGGAGGTRTLIFDAEGNCIYYIVPDGVQDPINDELGTYSTWQMDLLSQYISPVLQGKQLERTLFRWSPSQSTLNALAIVGLPLTEDGQVTGALLRVKNDSTIYVSVQMFLLLYACIGVILVIFFAFSHQRRKEQEQLARIKNNYVANVTHTLKTPLASVKALAEALCDEVVSDKEKQKVYCGRILLETKKLERTILDILELSELQNHEKDFAKTEVPAEVCFRATLDNYIELCDCLGISLRISEKVYRLPPLYTNAACIEKILMILLDNAVKFSDRSDIWVDATTTDKHVTICVNDKGVGISPEDLPLVFERFFTRNVAGNNNGSGLGLAIAKELIQGLNEGIWVTSSPHEGTTFRFTIRRAPLH